MKKTFLTTSLFLLIILSGFSQTRYWVSTIGGNWSNTANWSATSGGAGGASVPASGNLAYFNGTGGRNGSCLVDIAVNVGGITINGYTGTIDLLGNTFTTVGTNIFTSGTVANTGAGGSVALNNTTFSTTFNGTAFTTASITGTTGNVLFNGSSFGSSVTITKANNSNDSGTGNNTFSGAVSLTNSSTSSLLLGSTNKDTYNGTLTLNIANTGQISINSGGATAHVLNGNVVLNYSSTGNILFGQSGGPSTLASGKTITIGTISGSGPGNLTLKSFTTSTTAQTLNMTGTTGLVTIGPSCTFAGPLSLTAPSISLTTSTFSAASNFTKTGGTTDVSPGGNTFTTATFNNPSAGEFTMAGANPDTFNGNTVLNNTGTSRMQIALTSVGNVFNGNLTINHGGATNGVNTIIARSSGSTITINGNLILNQTNTDPSSGIIIANDGAVTVNGNISITATAGRGVLIGGDQPSNLGTVKLGSGFTVKEASAGAVTTGQVSFYRFTQTGSTAQSVNFSGSVTAILGPSSVFNGNLSFIAPAILLNGTTYNGTAYLEQNGTTDTHGTGGNVFATTSTLVNSGSGYYLTGGSNPDTFNGDVTINNSGSNLIYLGYNAAGNQFNGNIIVNQNGGNGIFFSNASQGTCILASGKTISVGGLGFSTGQLRLVRFTQNGSAPITLNMTGTSLALMGPSATFGGNFSVTAPQILLNGATYSGTAYIEKTGATDNGSDGGNTFSGLTTLVESGSGQLMTGVNAPDTFNADLTVTNTGSNWIFLSHNVPGTVFNGNITVNCTTGTGIIFSNQSTGTSSQAAGKTINIGATGFSGGELRIRRFTQNGSATVNLAMTGSSTLRVGPSTTFGGIFNAVAPGVLLDGATFTGTTTIEKNGAGNNVGNGGNVFSSTASLINSGSGYLLTANASPDTFNADVTISNTGSSLIYLSHNVPGNAYNGNIIVNSTGGTGITFSNNGPGASTQANGKLITVGTLGFTVGELALKRFTQNAPVNLSFTGLGVLRVGPSSTFGSTFTSATPGLYLDGATFTGTTYVEKNGPVANYGAGGNTFNGTTTMVNSGSGYLLTGGSAPDIFNADLTVTNSSSDLIYLAYNTGGNVFNGNIILNQTSGTAIYFSESNSGSSTLSSGKTISAGTFNAGELHLHRFTQVGATAQSMTLTGTAVIRTGPTTSFDGNVNFVTPGLYLDGTTFNGTAYLEKNGASNNTGNGSNVFNSTATLVGSGSGYLRTNGSNTFNGTTVLTSSGSGDLLLELNAGNTYNGDLTINSIGNNTVRMCYNGATAFNGNVIFNSTSPNGTIFCEQPTATATLADTKKLSIGATGFNNGQLLLRQFTQVGTTAQSLVLTSIASLQVGPTSVFNGNVDFRAPQLAFANSAFNGTAYLEKTGPVANSSAGNCTFASTATIVNSGSNYLRTTTGSVFSGLTTITSSGSGDVLLENTNGGTYNSDVIINNTGTANVRMSYAGTTSYNGNITVNSNAGLGVTFGEYITSTSTLATGKTITVGGLGFSSGGLYLQRFIQLGPTPQALTLTSNSLISVGPGSTFNGNVNFKAPQVLLQGATYNGLTAIEKTGATNNDSAGSNIFNGVTTLTNSGSGWLRCARITVDQFNNDLTLTNTGTADIRMSDQVIGSVYNGNIVVNCNLGGGVQFGNSNGSSTLATGKTLTIGALGFSIGELRLQNFTQTGATNQTIALTGNADIKVGPTSAFSGNVDFRAPQVLLDGATYNGTAYIEKNGAGNNTGAGNNVFATNATFVNSASGQFRTNGASIYNGPTTFVNSGTNDILFELASGSTYNGDVTFTNTGSSYIRVAYIGTNSFNGNIVVNSLNATGVFFCENTAGTATLASGKTISVGATGFSAGELRIQRFTQTGTTPQSLTLTGSGVFRTALATTWNGNVSVTGPTLLFDGSTFNGATNTFLKNGNSADNSVGGNTFNGNATFTNTGTGSFRLANSTGDAFNGNLTLVQTSGVIQPAYTSTNTITGDLSVTSATAIIFGTGGGNLTFSGGSNEAITKAGASSPNFARLVMNKSAGSVTLNTDIIISTTGTFTSGVINSTAANYVNFISGSTTSGASNASYVDGPVRKTGNSAFVFPVGNGGVYRSIAIANPGSTTDAFTAQFFKTAQAFGGTATYAPTLVTVSSCEYWILNRTTGTSNVNVTLSWNSPDCSGPYISDLTKLRVARFNGTTWADHGNGGTTGNITAGTIVTSAAVTSFSPFALASTTKANPLPIELVNFTAVEADLDVQINWITASELNNDFFDVERSADGQEFQSIASIKGAGTSNEEHRYEYLDLNPALDVVYYRLRQTDIDGKSAFSKMVKLVKGEITELIAWPNPSRVGKIIQLNHTGSYQLFNSFGQLTGLFPNTNKLDTSSLASGVYLLRAENGLLVRLVVE